MSRDTESRLTVNTKDVSGAFVFSTALYSSQPVSAKAKNRANTFEGVAPRDDARVAAICCYSIGLQQLVRQHEPPAPQVSGTKLQFSGTTAVHHLFIEMRLASPFLFLAPKMLLWARRVDSTANSTRLVPIYRGQHAFMYVAASGECAGDLVWRLLFFLSSSEECSQ